MSIFFSFSNWVMGGLRRSKGIQYSTPSSYAEDAASTVTYDSAMQLSAVWACVKLLSETVASLPLTVYKTAPEGRKPHDTHALSLLFSGKVNRYQTKVEFFETVLLNLVVNGNAYCVITRSGDRIVSLLPIMSAQVEPMMLDDGAMVYNYTNDSGITVFATENIWHLKLMGNGTVGMSPLAYQRNSLGIAQAAETAVTKIYRNGAKPSGVLSIDRLLKPEQRDQIRANFGTMTTSNDDRLMVLEAGMKFDKVSLSPQDIELLASRKFQISEVCRWYGVPSVMVNDNNGTSVWGSGIEQVMQGFYKLTLRPLLEKIEASIMVNLLTPAERSRMEVAFDFDALLRADLKSRYESYRLGISSGLMTPNEARAAEHLPAAEGGDLLYMQGAMAPIIKLAEPDPEPQPLEIPDNTDEINNIQAGVKSLGDEIRNLTTGMKSLRDMALQQKSQPATAPVINVTVPEQKHTINVAAPAVNVNVPESVVNIEAVMPEVKQIAPTVNITNEVRPAEVTVVDNHPKQAVQTVERDANDEIVRTVTKYEK
jgi:HK97 family phage portal protein